MQNIHISTTIKNLCKANGISITSLLHDCKLTKSFIYDLEKRSASPSCEKITKIADYLGCSVDYLLGRTDIVEVARSEEYVYLPIAARGPMSDDAVLTAEEKAAADAKHPELAPNNKKSDY